MARRKVYDLNGAVLLSQLSIADLYAMLVFVSADKNRGFSSINPKQKEIVDKKYNDIEEELYRRTYGSNPFAKKEATEEKKIVIDGQKPEDILDNMNGTVYVSDNKEPIIQTFVVKKNEEKEIEAKDEQPQTFVVAKNE